MAGQLKGKSALVTGSTSGIGRGIAELSPHEGANVMLNGLGDARDIERRTRGRSRTRPRREGALHRLPT